MSMTEKPNRFFHSHPANAASDSLVVSKLAFQMTGDNEVYGFESKLFMYTVHCTGDVEGNRLIEI